MYSTPSDGPKGPEFQGNERFRLLSQLGQGGSGIVYLAEDRQRQARVALKTLSGLRPTSLFRFKQEFRALADIHHPNLVRLHELVHADGVWFFTMDFIEGQPFEQFVAESRDPERLRPVLLQIAKGLNALHRAGKLHRDLKPENVLISGPDRALILDFGLVMDERRHSHETIDDGWVEGTPAFMSPEQALGDPLTPASDWYAFGVLAYEALTGKLPIDAPYPEILSRKVEQDPVAPSNLVPGLPADLDRLVLNLLGRDPGERPRGDEVLKVLRRNRPASVRLSVDDIFGPEKRTGFVGRGPQLEALTRALKATDVGKPTAVFVSGASGMGKTALVEHFLSSVSIGAEATILRGRCYERESVPYKALDSLIDDLCRYLRKLDDVQLAAIMPRRVDALASLFPVLRRVDAIANYRERHPLDQDAGKVRAQAHDALRELLGRIADDRPLLLFIDDLHWGDLDSAELLRGLLTHPEAPALLLIGTFRSDAAVHNPCVQRLRDLAAELRIGSRTIEMEPLDEAQSERLLDALKEEGEQLNTAELAREARGNPYFMAELVRFSRLETDKPRSQPPTMMRVMASRLGSLSDAERRLMELIAVANTPLSMDVLRLCIDEGTDLNDALLSLRQQQLIRLVGQGSSQVLTHHNLIRESVTELLSMSEQRAHHLRIADALEMTGSDDMEALATHLIGGAEPQRALAYAVRGAKLAERSRAFEQAVRLYEVAIAHRDEGPARRQLQVALADVLMQTGGSARAADLYLAAVEGAAAQEAQRLHARAAVALLAADDVERGLIELKDAMQVHGFAVPITDDEAMKSSALMWRQVQKRGLEQQPPATPPRAPDLARLDECHALVFAAYCAKTLSAGPLICSHLLDALEVGEPRRLARALCLFHCAVDLPLAQVTGSAPLQALRVARELATPLADAYLDATLVATEAAEAFLGGHWDAALEHFRTAAAAFAECPDCDLELTQVRLMALNILVLEARWPEACRMERSWIGPNPRSELLVDHHAALTAMLSGDLPSARESVARLAARKGSRGSLEHFMVVALAQGFLARLTIDADACAAHVREALAVADSRVGQIRAYHAIALWSALSCQLTRASCEQGAARDALVDAAEMTLERLDALGLPAMESAVVSSRAALSLLRGEDRKALTLLEAAARILGSTARELMVRLRAGMLDSSRASEHMTATANYALREMGYVDPFAFGELFVPGLRLP